MLLQDFSVVGRNHASSEAALLAASVELNSVQTVYFDV